MKSSKRTLSVLILLCMMMALLPLSAGAEADLSEQVDLIFYVMGDAPKDEAIVEEAINEVLLEKLNATIDFRFSTWTDFKQKYNNELTSSGADLIYIAGWLDYGLLAKAGAFLELDDLLDNYAPDLRARAGEDMLNMCRIDGELYAVPALWPEYVPLGVHYREDLRVKYDLPMPDSLENIEAYLIGIKENEPEMTPARMTTEESQGLIWAFDAFNVFSIKYPWVNTAGTPYGLASNYDTPADLYDYWYSEDFVEDCKLMKKWADLGFWSKSALSDTKDAELFNNGLTAMELAGMNPNKHIGSVVTFEREHPEWESGYIAYGEVTGVMYPGHATQNGTGIVRGTAHPERAMMVLDFLMMDETMNRLVQYGIEGTHYEINDGIYKALAPDDFTYEALNTWNLRVNEYKLPQESDIQLLAMFEEYAKIGDASKFPNINIAGGFTEDYTDYQTERTGVSNVMQQYLAPIQAGLVDDVEAAIAEFLEKAEAAGLQTCRDAYTEQWQAYCEEYGYQ